MIVCPPLISAARPLPKPLIRKDYSKGKGNFKYINKFGHDVYLYTIKGYRYIKCNEAFHGTDALFEFVVSGQLEMRKE